MTASPDLAAAFDAAKAICRRHARSFYFASHFLPRPKRDAAYAVYAFCRLLDDAVDEAATDAEREAGLARFERVLDACYAEAIREGEAPPEPRAPQVPAGSAGASPSQQLALAAFAHTAKRAAELSNYLDMTDDLLAEPLQIIDGRIRVPEGPGAGTGVNGEKLEHYRTDR